MLNTKISFYGCFLVIWQSWVTSCLLVVCSGCVPGRHDPDGEDCQAAGPGGHHLQQRLRQHPDLLSIQVKSMWSKLLIHVFVIAALKISCFSKVQQWQNEIKDVALNCAFAAQNFISHKFIFLSSSKCAQKQSVRRKIRSLYNCPQEKKQFRRKMIIYFVEIVSRVIVEMCS